MATEVSTAPVVAPRTRTRRSRPIPEGGRVNWGLTIIVAVCSLTILIPLYFAIAMALKSPAQTGTGTGFNFPWPIHWGNFRAAWDLTDTPLAFSMSLLVTVIAVVGEILVSSLAAWAIVRNWDHWQFRVTFVYLLAALFLPFPVVALPQVKLMAAIGLANPFGVGILHIMFQLAFNVLLFSAFIRSIPVELEESARLDGCTTLQTFRKIVLPLLTPIAATVGIFAFLQSWNDFMMPNLITANPKWQTLPVIQYLFQDQFTTNFNVAFASYLMALLPTLVVFLIAQRWVVSGIMRGSIKYNAPTPHPDWWRQAVVYQIYPRSFADSDGNGLGDLRGIISRIPYLAELGIDAVWLSPFYPSALIDGGYDVDDYRDVDPRLGTLADFDEMTARLHGCGIKVIVDIVPNHTSSRHAWFREALAAPKGAPARNRYIFRDGLGPDGAQPPSDWISIFGGPALGPRPRRAVVPAPVRPGAAGPELGQPRGPRRVRRDAAVLV